MILIIVGVSLVLIIYGICQLWKKNPKIIRIGGAFIVIAVAVFLLSFHIIPSRLTIFPKENLSFSNTFILEKDIEELIERHNNAPLLERLAINQEPLMRKLMEKGIITDKSSSFDE